MTQIEKKKRKSPPPFTLEHRRKIGLAQKGNKYHLGKKQTPEHIKNRVEGRRGYRHSEETKLKIREGNLGRENPKGENHYNWKGGITPINASLRAVGEYKQWRLAILKKDNYRCFDCGEESGRLEADHIFQFSKYPRLRFDINNGQALCRQCHLKKTVFERTGTMTVFG